MNEDANKESANEVELHDSTIQTLYGVGLQLENCLVLADESVPALKIELDAAIVRLYRVIEDVRDRIYEIDNREL